MVLYYLSLIYVILKEGYENTCILPLAFGNTFFYNVTGVKSIDCFIFKYNTVSNMQKIILILESGMINNALYKC